MRYCSTLVPIREAFDHVGKLEFRSEWSGEEAAAIAPGKRSSADPNTWRRGRHTWSRMMNLIESERIPIVFHKDGCRERYGTSPTPPITNLYPCPTNDLDIGFVELGEQDIYHARADIDGLPKPKLGPRKPTGPKERFRPFREACVAYFREFGFVRSNADVRKDLAGSGSIPERPGKTRERELINQAREQVMREPVAIRNSEKTASGAL